MTSGVYAIVNTATGKAYVGSSVDVERRWSGRRWELDLGRSANKELQTDWAAVQGAGFEWRILEETSKDNEALLAAETRPKRRRSHPRPPSGGGTGGEGEP